MISGIDINMYDLIWNVDDYVCYQFTSDNSMDNCESLKAFISEIGADHNVIEINTTEAILQPPGHSHRFILNSIGDGDFFSHCVTVTTQKNTLKEILTSRTTNDIIIENDISRKYELSEDEIFKVNAIIRKHGWIRNSVISPNQKYMFVNKLIEILDENPKWLSDIDKHRKFGI